MVQHGVLVEVLETILVSTQTNNVLTWTRTCSGNTDTVEFSKEATSSLKHSPSMRVAPANLAPPECGCELLGKRRSVAEHTLASNYSISRDLVHKQEPDAYQQA